jgi:hypothetical protein
MIAHTCAIAAELCVENLVRVLTRTVAGTDLLPVCMTIITHIYAARMLTSSNMYERKRP